MKRPSHAHSGRFPRISNSLFNHNENHRQSRHSRNSESSICGNGYTLPGGSVHTITKFKHVWALIPVWSCRIIENAAITITNEEKQPIAQAKDFFVSIPCHSSQFRKSRTYQVTEKCNWDKVIQLYSMAFLCSVTQGNSWLRSRDITRMKIILVIQHHSMSCMFPLFYSLSWITSSNYGLKIVNEISPVWYKDEGGKNNTILIHLQLVVGLIGWEYYW